MVDENGTLEMRVGTRWRSVVCQAEVIVVRGPATGDTRPLECGGWPMVPVDRAPSELKPCRAPHDTGSALGKRYETGDATLEVLCTKAGKGSLSIGDEALVLKTAKPLPASD